MSKFARRTSWCTIPIVVLAAAGCGGGIPGNAVVQVGSSPITKTTFTHWMTVAASSSKASPTAKVVLPEPPNYTACIANQAATAPKPVKGQSAPTTQQLKTQCEQQYKSLKTTVLGYLISSAEWLPQEASALGIKLSDAEVKKQFMKIRTQQFPSAVEFEKFLTNSGQTVSDLLLRVKINMLGQKIQQKVLKQKNTVTQAQIAKYYNENKSRYGVPEKHKVEIILTKTEAQAKSAQKEVQSGKSFASVAKKRSVDPTSKAGGLLPEVVKGQEQKALDEALSKAKQGVLSGPVKTPFGYYIFEVLGTTVGSQQTLAQVQTSIKQQLMATQQQTVFSAFVKNYKKKWKAKTDCRAEYVVEPCKQFKEPKTPAPLGGAQQGGAVTPQRVPQTATPKVVTPPAAKKK